MVVKLDGAAPCEESAGRPMTGILLPAATPLWDRSVARELRAALGREPDLVLLAGEDPGSSGFRCLAMLCLAGPLGGACRLVVARLASRAERGAESQVPTDNGLTDPAIRSTMPATAGVAEWQTRGTQNPVSARVCGFDSHLRHQQPTSHQASSEKQLPGQRLSTSAKILKTPPMSRTRRAY